MRTLSFELGLNSTHDNKLITRKYDELLKVKLTEFENYCNAYLNFRFGQFYLVIVYKNS
jgi:hypothetical protein